MKLGAFAGAVFVGLLLAACTQPTAPVTDANERMPSGASFDGGIGFGSGGRGSTTPEAGEEESTTSGPANSSTTAECEAGGVGFGSGGRTCPS